jgi:hypothetical protein
MRNAVVSRKNGAARLKIVEVDGETDNEAEDTQNEAGPEDPFWDNPEFFAKGGTLALATEADQAEALIK